MSELSVPIPENFRGVDDRFTGVIAGAPRFELLQRAVSYTITLEMMIDSVRLGVESVAARSRSDHAKELYAKCVESIRGAYQHYSSGQDSEGRVLLMQAHNMFRLAANKGKLWKV